MVEHRSQSQFLIALLCLVAVLCLLNSYYFNTSISKSHHAPSHHRNGGFSPSGHLSFGVNVYGWIRGDFGGGRTARSVINCLHAVKVNLSAIEIRGASLHSTTNTAIEEKGFSLFPKKDFAFDLFVINAANTISTLMDPSNNINQNHYLIGLWHWETSKLPPLQGSYGKYYNEIWVPTQFVADAILSTESFPADAVRVVVLPYGYETLPRDASTRPGQKRAHRQQLPHILRRISWQSKEGVLQSAHAEQSLRYWADTDADVTLFLVIFDFNSDYNRKNIISTVRAFLRAFPSNNLGSIQGSSTGLVIKSINARSQVDDFDRLYWLLQGGHLEGIALDERVVFFDGLCSEQDLQRLKLAADCYVSLHRAEGLGLNILEAVLAGVPVVASAFSGSEQFLAPLYEDLAPELRVPTRTVQVNREFGPYTLDMQWGEPSEAAAVNAMRLVYSYPAHYAALAAGPIRERALQLLSPQSTGAAMRARLQLLHDCMTLVQDQDQDSGGGGGGWRWGGGGLAQMREVCVSRVLGRRESISAGAALGLYEQSSSQTQTKALLTPARGQAAASLPRLGEVDEERESDLVGADVLQ